MFFENRHAEPDAQALAQYDAELRAYYQNRIGEERDWLYSIRKTLNGPVRSHMLPFLQKQGLLKQ